jgi:hypothetical protein
MAIADNFTRTGTGGFTSAMSVDRFFSFGSTSGGTSSNSPNLALTSGASVAAITTGSWFNALNFTGSTGTPTGNGATLTSVYVNTLTLATGGTYTNLTPYFTATQTWTPQFSKQLAGFGVNGTGITVTMGGSQSINTTGAIYLDSGTLDLGGFDQTCGQFSSSNTNTRSIAFGTNNIILAYPTAGTINLVMNIITGFTYTGTGGFTSAMSVTRIFTCGTTGGSTTNAPNLSLISGSSVPTITTGGYFGILSFTGSTGTPAATVVNVNTLTLASGGTYTSLGATFRGTGTFTPTGKTIAALTVNSSGTTTFASAVSCTTYTQTAGTVDFATYNLTCSGAVAFTAGTLSNTGTITCTTWTVTGTFTMTNGTITPSASFVLTSGAFNYNGGTLNAPTFTLTAGTVTLAQSLTAGTFSSTGTGVRTIAFGTSNITLTSTGTVWDTTIPTSLTTTGSKTVNITNATATATTVVPGPMTEAQAVDFNFTAGTYALTFLNTATHSARTVNFTGYSGAWSHAACTLYGSITYSNTMSVTDASRLTTGITFAATSGTQTLTSGLTVPIAPIIMNCPGATLALAAGIFTTVSNSLNTDTQLTLTNGTLDLNGSTLSVNRCITATGTKNITFNGGTLLCRSASSGTTLNGFNNAVPTGFTTTTGTSGGYITVYGGQFEGGNSTFNCTLQVLSLATSTIIGGSNTFTRILLTGTYPTSLLFTASTTTTVTNWNVNGVSPYYVTLDTSSGTGTFTLSKSSGTVSSSYLAVSRSVATGGATWYALASIDNGSNSGWTFSSSPMPPTNAAGSFLAFFDEETN